MYVKYFNVLSTYMCIYIYIYICVAFFSVFIICSVFVDLQPLRHYILWDGRAQQCSHKHYALYLTGLADTRTNLKPFTYIHIYIYTHIYIYIYTYIYILYTYIYIHIYIYIYIYIFVCICLVLLVFIFWCIFGVFTFFLQQTSLWGPSGPF